MVDLILRKIQKGKTMTKFIFLNAVTKNQTLSQLLDKEELDKFIENLTEYEYISKEKRHGSGNKPYFAKLKEHSIFDDLHITEITADISNMLNEFTVETYEFNPVYQRNLVWSTEKKQAFVKKLLIGDVDLCPTLIAAPFKESRREYEVLDVKQRMMAVIQFIQGQFPVEGFYYKDLSLGDVTRLMNSPFKYKLVKYYSKKDSRKLSEMTLKQKVELFLQINEYGQKVSDEHLEKIKKQFISFDFLRQICNPHK